MSVLDTLKTRLAEAEAAYHSWLLGGRTKTFVDQNGERVEYAEGSLPRLAAYIESLKAQIAALEGTAPSGPLNVWM